MSRAATASRDRADSPPRGGSLAGTLGLVRLIVRRDRVRLAVWVLAIAVSVFASVASFSETYPTAEDREARASLLRDSPVTQLFTGPGYGLDDYTYGAMTANEMLPLTAVAVALMSIFLVVRNTRTEEESGRAELVRAAVVGRHAYPAATLIVVGGANLVLGLLLTLGLPASLDGLGTTGSLAFAAAAAGVGLVFTGVALVTAQVAVAGRSAVGIASIILGALYVLRSIGDMDDGTLAWSSPFGWAIEMRAYVGERWWPLALAVALAVALIAVGVRINARRDVGAGAIADRPGRPRARSTLGGAFGLAFRLQRVSLLAWGGTLFAFAILYGSLAEQASTLYEDLDSLDEYLARIGAADPVDQFLALTIFWSALIATAYVIQSTTRLRAEEAATRAEPLLATPTSRWRWLASHTAIAIGGGLAVLVAIGLGFGASRAVGAGDLGELPRALAAALVYAPATWAFAGATLALYGLIPRATASIWGILAAILFIEMFGPLLQFPSWIYDISPFQHIPQLPVAELRLAPLAVVTAIAAALGALGAVAFRRRDLA
ncbi:MAG TPA: ABC transporter permease [Solirubrobacterales bacterium]|nr:ABC transporter permease [Solirubrobacterales bacterium]